MPLTINFQLSENWVYNRAKRLSHYPSVHPQFNSNYPYRRDVDSIEVTADIRLSTEKSTVYAGKFITWQHQEEIVLKVRDNVEDAKAEASRYQQLKDLQGSIIPRFYGLFRVKKKSGGYLGGIILERFGKPVDRMLENLEHETKARILHHMDRIHKAGIAPDDLEPRHVLSNGNDLRIIDFTTVLPHKCPSNYAYLAAPEVVADLKELAPARKCRGLYSFAFEMGFWTIPKVVINDFPYNAKGLPTDPEIIKLLNPGRFLTTYNSHQLITLLKVYYQNVHRMMESGVSVEELQKDMEQLMNEAEEEWTIEFPSIRYGYRHEASKQPR